jgi:hypothetical protein
MRVLAAMLHRVGAHGNAVKVRAIPMKKPKVPYLLNYATRVIEATVPSGDSGSEAGGKHRYEGSSARWLSPGDQFFCSPSEGPKESSSGTWFHSETPAWKSVAKDCLGENFQTRNGCWILPVGIVNW